MQVSPTGFRSEERTAMTPTRLGAAVCLLLAGLVFAAEIPEPAPAQPITIIDTAGKEQKLKSWKYTSGTRRLTWLADKKEKGKNAGPEALEFREDDSTTYAEGVLTLVPLD